MKILLLEDEYSLRKSIKEMLEESGFSVEEFSNGDEAFDAIYYNSFDLLILDVNVPGMNGFELLEQAKQHNMDIPAIFVTSLTQIDSLERGYDLGCCDYIKKPFDLAELRLRVSSALKLSSFNTKQNTLKLPLGYEYDFNNFTLKHNNREVQLSKTEKMIFELFVKHKNQIVTPDMIKEYVWDSDVDPANIRVQVGNLRKKLHKDFIVNIRGLGYKLAT